MDAGIKKNQDLRSKQKNLYQFHPSHRTDIILKNDATVALRQSDEYAILFSKQPLAACELFIMEFSSALKGKTADLSYLPIDMIVALTPEQPNANIELFQLYSSSLIMLRPPFFQPPGNIFGNGTYLSTTRGLIPKKMLLPSVDTEDNVRVGIMYVPTRNDPKKANFHVIFNGKDAFQKKHVITLGDDPLYIGVIFFGDSTKIRIIQSQGVSSLQNACRHIIRENFTTNRISKMPLPERIKQFLLTHDY